MKVKKVQIVVVRVERRVKIITRVLKIRIVEVLIIVRVEDVVGFVVRTVVGKKKIERVEEVGKEVRVESIIRVERIE